jgi:hypothetical protein
VRFDMPDRIKLPGLNRNRRWRLEWRRPVAGDGAPILLARELPTAQAARSVALNIGEAALGGEFRLSARDIAPVITNLEGLRRWEDYQASPAAAPRSLWAFELKQRGHVDDFLSALRQAVDRACSAGVLAAADGLALIRIASTLTAC